MLFKGKCLGKMEDGIWKVFEEKFWKGGGESGYKKKSMIVRIVTS